MASPRQEEERWLVVASPGQHEGRAMRVWKAICIRDFLNSHSHCK